jgi:DNA modification methylase
VAERKEILGLTNREVMVVKSKIEHINYALVAKTHTPMYLMHKYWARKPHNVVSEYIRHYSKEGDVVLDPFAGSGVTAIEAIKLGRRAIAIDLDPMATFITKVTATPVDLKTFEQEFRNIEKKIKEKVYKLYKTNCAKCRKEAIIEAVIWEKDKPKEIRYSCKCVKGTQWKNVTDTDLKRLKNIEGKSIPYWYPKNELIWNSRVNVRHGEKVYELFTKRNLMALSMILNEIGKVKDKKVKDLLKFTFSSALAQASKLVFVYRMKERNRDVGGWATRGYWVPNEYFEINAWNCFGERFNKILRGKEESNSLIKEYKEAKNFNELNDGTNILIKTFNTLELDKIIPANSVEYVFTDPPYGDAVPYLELDYMWSSWLKFSPAFEDEIIISDSPVRNKTEEIYDRMLKAAFSQVYKVLKSGKYMTVTFHNTDIKIWNAIISSCIYAGFDLEKILYQVPARPSAKGLLAQYGSAVGDYYIRFKKPERIKQNELEQLNEERYKRIILDSAKKIIADRGEPTPYTFILNGIIVDLKEEGALLLGKSNPDDVMKEFLNKEFVLIDVKDEKGEIIGKKWWFKNPSSVSYVGFISLADRVETAIVDVLRRKVKISFDDVLQEIFIKFPNALTPETQNIKEILREYATPTKDGNWILKPQVKRRESQHSEMIYYLALLGRKAGLDVWIGQKEQGETYNKQKLFSLMTNKDPLWRHLPTFNLDRIIQIDVIWHHEGRVRIVFEVENTTAITEAIVRGSNIPHDSVKRIIVIPEEREGLLFRKMKEPMLSENIIKNNWKFLFYKDIKNYFEKNKKSKKINLSDFEKLFKLPQEARPIQNSFFE